MTVTEYHLKLAIYRWCGAVPEKYVPDSYLRDVWSAYIPHIPYEPEGIRRLGQQIYADPMFQGCTAAHNLIPQEFFKGGDIQSVRQLYVRLLPCEPTPAPVPITTEAMFR